MTTFTEPQFVRFPDGCVYAFNETDAPMLDDNSLELFADVHIGDRITWKQSRCAGREYSLDCCSDEGVIIDKTADHVIVCKEYGMVMFHKSNLGDMSLQVIERNVVQKMKSSHIHSYEGHVTDKRTTHNLVETWGLVHSSSVSLPENCTYSYWLYLESGKYDYYITKSAGYNGSRGVCAYDPATRTPEIHTRIAESRE